MIDDERLKREHLKKNHVIFLSLSTIALIITIIRILL